MVDRPLGTLPPVLGRRSLVPVAAAAALGAVVFGGGQLASGRSAARAAACPVFPKNNQWNLPVDKLPVAKNSDTLVNKIGRAHV